MKANIILLYAAGIVISGHAETLSATDIADQQPSYQHFERHHTRRPSTNNRQDRFIVKYRDSASATQKRDDIQLRLEKAAVDSGISWGNSSNKLTDSRKIIRIRQSATGAELIRTRIPLDTTQSLQLLTALRSDPNVQYAQVDTIKFSIDFTPNDPAYSARQWHYYHQATGIEAPEAWRQSTGSGVVVAVLDTGFRPHRDLASNIIPGYDLISWHGQNEDGVSYPDIAGDGDGRDADASDPGDWLDGREGFCSGYISDSSWHGTHVAGTVAAVTNNGLDVAGIAFDSKVQPIRVLGHCGGLTSDIADGIVWAAGGSVPGLPLNQTPAEVINMSLGGYGRCDDDPATQEAINEALLRGVTVVVAAGNDNSNAANYTPASCRGVITVGATGVDGARSYFSNYGTSVTVAAPGGNASSALDPPEKFIWSLGNRGKRGPEEDAVVGQIGTSMAAPHVAGIVALIQSASVAGGHAPLAPTQVSALLRGTVKPFLVNPGTTTSIGAGIADAARAVRKAYEGVTPEDLATRLNNGQPILDQRVRPGDSLYFQISVPAGSKTLNIRTYGGTGDVSLRLSRDSLPSDNNVIATSNKAATIETLLLTRPAEGVYFLAVDAVRESTGFSVLATN